MYVYIFNLHAQMFSVLWNTHLKNKNLFLNFKFTLSLNINRLKNEEL